MSTLKMSTLISEAVEQILEEQGFVPDPRAAAQRIIERNERLRNQERAWRRIDKNTA